MSEEIKSPELTAEEIAAYDEKSAELAKKYQCSKVHAVVFIDKETMERRACFLKEPNFPTKIAVMDKAQQVGIFVAGEELRQGIVLKEESDPVTYGDTPECDDYKMGVVTFCVGLINVKANAYKKK